MFQSRELKILRELFENGNKIYTTHELSLLLSVSQRTIKNDLKNLNQQFSNSTVQIGTQPGKGIWLEYEPSDKSKIESMLIQGSELLISANELRQIQIIEFLIGNPDYVAIEEIAQSLFVSNSTVSRELDAIDLFLKKHMLSVAKEPRIGVKILGTEQNKRIAHAEVFKKKASLIKISQTIEEIELNFPNTPVTKIAQVLQKIQKEMAITFSELTYKGLLVHTAITIERLLMNKELVMSSSELNRLKTCAEWEIAVRYTEELAEICHLTFNESETGYITIHLLGANLVNPEVKEQSLEPKAIDPELYNNLIEWTIAISQQYKVDFLKDDLFIATLFFHLKPLLNRATYGITISNPWIQELKTKHSLYYEIAVSFSELLQKEYENLIKEDEIGYISMHIGAAIERLSLSKVPNYQIVIVCASGIGTSHFLKSRMNKEFPAIEVIEIMSSIDPRLLSVNCDFVVSTVPIKNLKVPVIEITPLLNEKDCEKVEAISVGKKERSETLLSKLLDQSISTFNCDEVDCKKVIELAAAKLAAEGFVDDTFAHAVWEREKLSSTAVGNLLAIPHASQGHIHHQGIGIVQLKKPISWGSEKVQLAFVLALDSQSQNDFMTLFEEILEISEDLKRMDQLINAKDFESFKRVIERV